MLTLKHLAREFNLDPYKLRQHLRNQMLTPQTNKRWTWPDAKDPHYVKTRNQTKAYALKISGRSSSKQAAKTAVSPKDLKPMPPASTSAKAYTASPSKRTQQP